MGLGHTPECGYGFRTRLRTRTQVRERKMYGVRVNVDFVVRKIDRVRFVFLYGVRVRLRKKLVLKSWCVLREEYGNFLKCQVQIRNLRRKIYGLHLFSFVSVSDQYFIPRRELRKQNPYGVQLFYLQFISSCCLRTYLGVSKTRTLSAFLKF